MSETKTPREIDAMSSEEYAKYIKYQRTETAAVPPVVEPVVQDDLPPVDQIVPALPEQVIPEQVVPPAPPAERRFEYQAHDEQGRPLGGKQVILYTDEADLQQKFAAKEEQLVRRLREVTRKQKLGITDEIALPADTEFETLEIPQPKVLTAEERFQLSQDINDPEKSIDAVNKIFEASVGLSSEQMRQQYSETQLAKLQYKAASNYLVFESKYKNDFWPDPENKKVLTDWMFKKGLAPTVANFELAHSKLKEAGLLLDNPIVREETPAPTVNPPALVSTEPKPQAPVVPESRITPVEQPQAKRQARVPSGLNNSNSSASDPSNAGPKTTLTLAEIDSMSSDDYKKKMKDPSFRKLVDELESQAAARRRASIA